VAGGPGNNPSVGALVEAVDDDADRQAQEPVDPAHVLGPDPDEVVVGGDDVDTLSR